jgi:NAD(P)-dependent dehydrogenase (short-subunit alcohol dehydrogenase family)
MRAGTNLNSPPIISGISSLTCRLWPALVASERTRVALTSKGHRRAGVDFHHPNFERPEYDPWVAYGQSKAANALFAVALDSIGQRQGVRAFSVHSGGIVPDLIRHIRSMRVRLSTKPASRSSIRRTTKTPQQGAATSVGATSPQLNGLGGVYCEGCGIARALPSDDSKELHGPDCVQPIPFPQGDCSSSASS